MVLIGYIVIFNISPFVGCVLVVDDHRGHQWNVGLGNFPMGMEMSKAFLILNSNFDSNNSLFLIINLWFPYSMAPIIYFYFWSIYRGSRVNSTPFDRINLRRFHRGCRQKNGSRVDGGLNYDPCESCDNLCISVTHPIFLGIFQYMPIEYFFLFKKSKIDSRLLVG